MKRNHTKAPADMAFDAQPQPNRTANSKHKDQSGPESKVVPPTENLPSNDAIVQLVHLLARAAARDALIERRDLIR